MKLNCTRLWLPLVASCWVLAGPVLAQAADTQPAAAAVGVPERITTPLLTEKKLTMLHERIGRKLKMSDPARQDQPHEAVAFYANKRTGPILTRGPNVTRGMRPLDPAAYMNAVASERSARPGRRANSFATTTAIDTTAAAVAGGLLGNWSELGPNNQGGRTRQLLIDPTNPSVMYAASVGGGVWKSTDGGAHWNQLTDLILPNIAVGSLAMDPSNSQVLYAGTGEGFFNGDAIRGNGIYKSTDGGATWASLAATVPTAGLAGDFSYVNQIVVSARYPQRVYAATRTGLFRSNDGGVSWTTLVNATAVRGCQDLVMQQKRSVGYVFAACGTFAIANIYRGLDSPSSTFASVFTTANMGRTALAIAPSNESYVYALAAHSTSHGMLGVFRSTANGSSGSWTTQVANTAPIKLNTLQLTNPVYAYAECVGGSSVGLYNQGWYDNVIAVDPANPEVVWTGGIDLMRSDDGGRNWGIASYWWAGAGDPNYAHADNHVIRFHPGYDGAANKKMYVASDGGVFRTDDARAAVGKTVDSVCGAPVAGAVTWTELNNQYATTQFYNGAVYPDGNSYLGGMQDNGTWRGTTASANWTKLQGGDGGYVAVDTRGDANDLNDVLFSEYTGLSIQRSINGGATFQDAVSGITGDSGFAFIAPFAMNASFRQQLWTGGYYIWRTTNQGTSWTRASAITAGQGSISAVASSPTDPNRVIVGMSDGFIHSTATGLSNTSATAWPVTQPRAAFVSAVAFDPNSATTAFLTYSTFTGSSVYKSIDGGISWVAMPGTGANLLPKVPATAVVVDPGNSSRVYVGTDIGVYTSGDGGLNWYRENVGFGNVSVEHLEINSQGTRRLYAFTHGRGAWRVDLNP